MSILIFELAGEMAMWRNVYESMGSYSCLGPAPGNRGARFRLAPVAGG